MIEVEPHGNRWTARDGTTDAGKLVVLGRPDSRCVLRFTKCAEDAYEPLLTAAAAALRRDLYVNVNETNQAGFDRYLRLGFTVNRREDDFVVPTDAPALEGAVLPDGFDMITAAEADRTRLRELDDLLRQDIPGTGGWQWAADEFDEELTQPAFDPVVYRLAVHRETGEYAGLARIWLNESGPRLGCIATVREHRREGIARALIAAVFGVLTERGLVSVTTDVDQSNTASQALMRSLGARRTGGWYELVLRR